MKDATCVDFLQWALPQLHMRWSGFRRVRGQVCKRLQRRIDRLGLTDVDAYRGYLEHNAEEWHQLDIVCRVTVSRFYRNKAVFAYLTEHVFPCLIKQVHQRGDGRLRIWCAGCGAGEEPYTLALLWAMKFKARSPELTFSIVATDADCGILERARQACYQFSSIKELPLAWIDSAFERHAENFCLRPAYYANIQFDCQDVRQTSPQGPFDLILCRNLAFTYFDEPLQLEIAKRFRNSLAPAGVLVIGVHERLPANSTDFATWSCRLGVYQCRSEWKK